jgi:hypothetical protein
VDPVEAHKFKERVDPQRLRQNIIDVLSPSPLLSLPVNIIPKLSGQAAKFATAERDLEETMHGRDHIADRHNRRVKVLEEATARHFDSIPAEGGKPRVGETKLQLADGRDRGRLIERFDSELRVLVEACSAERKSDMPLDPWLSEARLYANGVEREVVHRHGRSKYLRRSTVSGASGCHRGSVRVAIESRRSRMIPEDLVRRRVLELVLVGDLGVDVGRWNLNLRLSILAIVNVLAEGNAAFALSRVSLTLRKVSHQRPKNRLLSSARGRWPEIRFRILA